MPQFILLCRDKPNALDLRLQTRPAHLEYFAAFAERLVLAGPILDEAGNPNGSMLIVQAADRAEAEEIAENDPYNKAGLFAEVTISPFKTVIANFPKG